MKRVDCDYIYQDGLEYDAQNRDFVSDIPFYLHQIEKYGEPVLELACGTGRITIPIAEQGIKISGLDISESMLLVAKEKSTAKRINIEWFKTDCRDFNLDREFNVIFFPFNSIAHLHDLEDIESCFSCVKKHLKNKGRFIIDIFNPSLDILLRDSSKRYPVAEYPDPYGRGTVTITETPNYDATIQVNRVKWYYKINNHEEIAKELGIRIFFPQELDMLLHYNGFAIESKFGNYDETPFVSTSPKQLIVCCKCRT